MDDNSRREPFAAIWWRFRELRHRGDLQGALELATTTRAERPEHREGMTRAIAGVLADAGQHAAAMRELQSVLDAGMWWSEVVLRHDPDLARLQGHPDFQALIAVSDELCRATAPVEARHFVFTPQGAPTCVLVCLHGMWDTPERLARPWRAGSGAGALVVVPQSTRQTISHGALGWPDEELARAEVGAAYRAAAAAHDALGLPVIIAGFSIGATYTVEWALRAVPFPTVGFVALGPPWIDPQAMSWLAGRGPLRGALLTGTMDFARQTTEGLYRALADHDVPVRLEVTKDGIHLYPPDFDKRLQVAIRFVNRS